MTVLLTAMDCGTLTNPANGQVSHTAGTTFGKTANYTCDPGYILVGGKTRTCQATGVWSGIAPTCQGMLSLPLYKLVHNRKSIYFTCVIYKRESVSWVLMLGMKSSHGEL